MNKVLFTIGTNMKSAKIFFELLKENDIKLLIDIRLNNSSQLLGFAKGGVDNLGYLLEKITNVKYIHDLSLAPTKELLDNYKKGNISWEGYVKEFKKLIVNKNMIKKINEYFDSYDRTCILCTEVDFNECHRGILAEKISNEFKDILVKHI